MISEDRTIISFGNYALTGPMVPRLAVVEYAEVDVPPGREAVRIHALLYDEGYPPLTALTRDRVVLRLNRVCTTYQPVTLVGFYRPNSIAFCTVNELTKSYVRQGALIPAPPIKAATLQCGLFLADFPDLEAFVKAVYGKGGVRNATPTPPPEIATENLFRDLGGEGGGA